jgi:NADPH:quinone reductase-like Zn-dependent oxidoreductase
VLTVQFAKITGARVVATTSSDDKAQVLRDLGVDHVVNYKTDPNWGETARAYTQEGFDHIIDVGGASTLGQTTKAVALDGIISLIGFLGDGDAPSLISALYNGFIARGIHIGSKTQFEEMIRAIEANNVKPVIDKVFQFRRCSGGVQASRRAELYGKSRDRVVDSMNL